MAAATIDHIVAVTRFNPVSTAVPADRVVAIPRLDLVISAPRIDRIVARSGNERVASTHPGVVDRVVARTGQQQQALQPAYHRAMHHLFLRRIVGPHDRFACRRPIRVEGITLVGRTTVVRPRHQVNQQVVTVVVEVVIVVVDAAKIQFFDVDKAQFSRSN